MAMANPRDERAIDQGESLVGMSLFKSLFETPIDLKTFIFPLCWATMVLKVCGYNGVDGYGPNV
jgi:hypothetical protein